MSFAWLKRYAPRSLYGRAALILLLPVITLQAVVSVVFIQRLFEDVTRQMTGNVAYEIGYLLDIVEDAPDAEAALARVAPVAERLAIEVELPDPAVVTGRDRLLWDLSGRLIIPTLMETFPGLLGIDLATNDDVVDLSIETAWGPMGLRFDRDRVSAENPHQLLVIMILTALLMTLVSYLFLRNQLRPVKRLAEAAAAFGRGRSVPYQPGGATEMRAAGAAFLHMRARLERQIEQRTTMLSGISHDLRTPLTRLNLSLSMSDDPDADAMRADLDEMRRMLDGFLDFARDGALDDPEDADPEAILHDVVAGAKRTRTKGGVRVEIGEIEGAGIAMLRPLAVKRALENLVSNAVKHGARRVRVSMQHTPRAVVFVVEDDGPGIPEDRREEAMRAFSQLDAARNQDRGGGVGLGLAIAQDIARQHGGVLRLDKSEDLGGLRADLVLAK